jgi:hypothetical protein
MSELRQLPPVDPRRLEEARSAVRRFRRRRRAVLLTSAGSVAVVAIAVLVGGRAATTLRMDELQPAKPSPATAPRPLGTVPTTAPLQGQPGSGLPRPATNAAASPQPFAAAPGRLPAPDARPAREPMDRSHRTGDVSCEPSPYLAVGGQNEYGERVCANISVQRVSNRRFALTLTTCRSPGGGEQPPLRFASAMEADFTVESVQGSKRTEIWRWSRGAVWPRTAHTLELKFGECWSWTTQWRGTTATGQQAGSGDYVIRAVPKFDNAHTGTRTATVSVR